MLTHSFNSLQIIV
ncbi:CRISPR-associated DxTHG motif protein [Vibrio sp. 99-70-13A1]|nr:CRISPR-associated DxTHG motif protein [Vibrio sp. 99-70-13A1]